MNNLRRISLYLAAAAILAPSVAEAAVTVQFVKIPPGPAAAVQTLATNGWECYLLVATADATSGKVGGWDLSTPHSTVGNVTSNKTSTDWGIFVIGSIAQRWTLDPDTLLPLSTNYGALPALANPISSTIATSPDSFFFTSGAFAQATAPAEDNNLQTGPNPPYSQNPNSNTTSLVFGVGTFMKAAGTVQAQAQVQSQVIAQVWLPRGTPFQARGVVTDSNAVLWGFFAGTLEFFPAEPGSLAMLGIGAVMLAKRRGF